MEAGLDDPPVADEILVPLGPGHLEWFSGLLFLPLLLLGVADQHVHNP